MLNTFFQKIMPFFNVEKYDRTGQATYDNILWSMCTACWATKATDTRS